MPRDLSKHTRHRNGQDTLGPDPSFLPHDAEGARDKLSWAYRAARIRAPERALPPICCALDRNLAPHHQWQVQCRSARRFDTSKWVVIFDMPIKAQALHELSSRKVETARVASSPRACPSKYKRMAMTPSGRYRAAQKVGNHVLLSRLCVRSGAGQPDCLCAVCPDS